MFAHPAFHHVGDDLHGAFDVDLAFGVARRVDGLGHDQLETVAWVANHAEAVDRTFDLPGQPHVFIHGEAQAVMHNLRPFIRKERGIDAKWASSISGYWRRGRTEETFRQWKKQLAEAESANSSA